MEINKELSKLVGLIEFDYSSNIQDNTQYVQLETCESVDSRLVGIVCAIDKDSLNEYAKISYTLEQCLYGESDSTKNEQSVYKDIQSDNYLREDITAKLVMLYMLDNNMINNQNCTVDISDEVFDYLDGGSLTESPMTKIITTIFSVDNILQAVESNYSDVDKDEVPDDSSISNKKNLEEQETSNEKYTSVTSETSPGTYTYEQSNNSYNDVGNIITDLESSMGIKDTVDSMASIAIKNIATHENEDNRKIAEFVEKKEEQNKVENIPEITHTSMSVVESGAEVLDDVFSRNEIIETKCLLERLNQHLMASIVDAILPIYDSGDIQFATKLLLVVIDNINVTKGGVING